MISWDKGHQALCALQVFQVVGKEGPINMCQMRLLLSYLLVLVTILSFYLAQYAVFVVSIKNESLRQNFVRREIMLSFIKKTKTKKQIKTFLHKNELKSHFKLISFIIQ